MYVDICIIIFQVLADNLPSHQFVEEMLKLLNRKSPEWLVRII